MSHRKIVMLSRALSPVTHMERNEGNEGVHNRRAVRTPDGVRNPAVISGNALRHSLVREPGWSWLFREYGVAASLPMLDFALNGGSIAKGASVVEDLARAAEFRRLFPLGALLGGCLPDQTLEGTLSVFDGTLVCRENAAVVDVDMPGLTPRRLVSESSLMGRHEYHRFRSGFGEPRSEAEAEGRAELAIFAGEHVVAGAAFVHGFVIRDWDTLKLGALLWSLKLWRDAGATVGGMAAKGHGRLDARIVSGVDPDEAEGAANAYREYAIGARDKAVAWLEKAFAPRPAKEKKAAAKAKAKALPEPAAEPEDATCQPSLF